VAYVFIQQNTIHYHISIHTLFIIKNGVTSHRETLSTQIL